MFVRVSTPHNSHCNAIRSAYITVYFSQAAQGIPSRGSTFSAGSNSEEYFSDTIKRRRKFSWVKSNFMRRKTEKKISGSQTELNSHRLSNTSFDVGQDTRPQHFADPLRKSVSLELLPSAIENQEMYQSRTTISSDGSESTQGYLRYVYDNSLYVSSFYFFGHY